MKFSRQRTLLVAGITYRYSPDGGNLWRTRDLGTDTSITLPNGGGKYNLVGQLPLLLARLVDLRAMVLAHVAFVGTVHGSADAGPYTITARIDDATALTCCADLQTTALGHVVKISAGIHGAADTTAQTAITALSVPATRAEAIVFAEAFATAFFGDGVTVNSGHTRRTAGGVHGAVDATNVLTAPPAVAGEPNWRSRRDVRSRLWQSLGRISSLSGSRIGHASTSEFCRRSCRTRMRVRLH